MINTLVIGNLAHPEFAAPLSVLARATCAEFVDDYEHALAILQQHSACDLLIAAQATPGSIPLRFWNQLRAAAPITPALLLLGSWCEGEERTGQPLPGAMRVYWHAFAEFFAGQLARLQRGEAPLWTAPLTATEVDHALERRIRPAAVGHALVVSHDLQLARMLNDALSRAGWRVSQRAPHETSAIHRATLALWDAPDASPAALAEFSQFRRHLPDVPIVVLAGFPRADQVAQWQQAGAARVLSKPLYIDELLQTASAFAQRVEA